MKIALHICCAVCAAGAAERLIAEGHQVFGFFYNPNIHPQEEYERRLESARRVAEELGFPLEVGAYTPDEWLKATSALASEPEGGKRCPVCFKLRLEKTCEFMKEHGYDAFTTTLSMGSNKSAIIVKTDSAPQGINPVGGERENPVARPQGVKKSINKQGEQLGGDSFLKRDFKKKEGFKRATELAKKWGLYRQNYCGCIYSMRSK